MIALVLPARAASSSTRAGLAESRSTPATADLAVQPDPCPGGLTTCPISDGGTVFLGEKLKITTTVGPNPAEQPLTDWRFDYDFHDGNPSDSNASYPRVSVPDLAQSAGNSPPSTILVLGPCDPRGTSGVDPATGANCWTSVLVNSSSGGPDFIAPLTVASEGTSKTLAFALEVRNALNAPGTSGLRKFSVRWQVPRVRLKSTSILLGAAVEDASEGRPAATGFKWYFAALPGTPATADPLQPDASCTGTVCNHAFAGKGTYEYWLTVPFRNGYVSEDCGSPCVRSRGQVSVSDVILAFTAPSSVPRTSPTVPVTNQSVLAPVVTPCAGYEYSLCETGSPGGSCVAASWSPLAFSAGSASIPTPAVAGYPAYFWLRIRYSYHTGAGCLFPTTATWLPNVVSGTPDAWPLSVFDKISTTTTVSSSVNPSRVGQSVTFTATVTPATGGGTPTGTVQFRSDGTDQGPAIGLVSGATSISLWGLTEGTHAITASYGGDGTFAASTGALPGGQVVLPTAASSTGVTSSPNPSQPGQSVTITATVTPASGGGTPTGTVQFKSDGTSIGGAVALASGSASASTSALAPGTHVITAEYSGDTTFAPSTGTLSGGQVVGTLGTAMRLYTVAPCRLLDTRDPAGVLGGPALAAGQDRAFVVAGVCGVPSGARALSLNVTVTGAAAAGYLTLHAGGSALPPTSTINFQAGQTRANNATIPLPADGSGALGAYAGTTGPVHVIVDVNGYFQ